VSEAARVLEEEKGDYLELRGDHVVDRNMPTSETKVRMFIDLDLDSEALWETMGANVRRRVRRAEKAGLECRVGGLGNLEAFYEIFARSMRRLGTPVIGRSFFESVLREFPEESSIFLAVRGGEAIAGTFAVSFKRVVEGLWACSLRKSFEFNANEFLYWKHLESGCRDGFLRFDLGRSTKESGSFKFKKKFGAHTRQLYYQYCLSRTDRIPVMDVETLKYRIARGVWKRMPLRLTKQLGPHIRKYMPQ
jgi:FemAB-related protein (PEP-CTERM system-associated)